jgi:probable F420-dependent oxidoreductase
MKIGIHLRNAGPHATREMLADCARIADELPIDDLWVFDHLAIPSEESEGSGGLYVDPLATLAFVAAITERVSIGTRVLILPYRPAFPTAKWVASIQTLSGGRLQLGVGVGWMEAEFRALDVPRSRRGAIADETLELLHKCFESDEIDVNGQTVLFRPRPARPPIFVGGRGSHALARAARYGDGWAAPNDDQETLREPIAELRRLFAEAGKPEPEIIAAGRLPLDDYGSVRGKLGELSEMGVTRYALGVPYSSAEEFRTIAEQLLSARG